MLHAVSPCPCRCVFLVAAEFTMSTTLTRMDRMDLSHFRTFAYPLQHSNPSTQPAQIYAMPASPAAQAQCGTHQCPKKAHCHLDVLDVRVTWSLRKQRDPQLRYTMYETSSFRGVVACKRVVSWRLFRAQAGKAGSVSSPSSKQTPHGRASIASDTPACGFQVQSLFCLFCDCHLMRNGNFDEKWAPNTLSIFPSEYPPDHVALRAMLWADKAHKACGHLSEHCIRSTRREPNGTTTSCKTPKWWYLTIFKIIELYFCSHNNCITVIRRLSKME